MAQKASSHYKMSKSLKRVLARMPNGEAKSTYTSMMIAAEIHYENWRRYGNRDKSAKDAGDE